MRKPIRVLIADDSITIRMVLMRMLENNGIEVAGIVENGLDVITRYKDLKPDIVIMDILMPKLSGKEALKQLKEIDPATCVIMLSSMSTKESVEECMGAGAKNYILKPFEEQKVIAAIHKAMED